MYLDMVGFLHMNSWEKNFMVWGDILPFWGLFYLLGDFGEHFAFNFVNYYLYLLKRLLFDILLRDMYKVRKKQTNLTERCVL